MKSFMRLALSIAILFAITSPVYAKNDTLQFYRYQRFEGSAMWDFSTDEAQVTKSIQIYSDSFNNEMTLSYTEAYTSDTVAEFRWFSTWIDSGKFEFKSDSNFSVDLNELGYYTFCHFENDESQSYCDSYEAELTLNLNWDYLYPYKQKNNEHIDSVTFGKIVNKVVEDYGHYAVSGMINGETLEICDSARVGTYRYKQQFIMEYPMFARVMDVFQEKSMSYSSFAIWEDPATPTTLPFINLMFLYQPMMEEMMMDFTFLRCSYDPDTMVMSCFMFEGKFNEENLMKPSVKNLTSTLHGDASGTITIVDIIGQDMNILDSYEGSLHLGLTWEFTDWQFTRNNTRTTEDLMKSHEIRLQESYFGTFSGEIGDFSFMDVNSSVNQIKSHTIYH